MSPIQARLIHICCIEKFYLKLYIDPKRPMFHDFGYKQKKSLTVDNKQLGT